MKHLDQVGIHEWDEDINFDNSNNTADIEIISWTTDHNEEHIIKC